MADTELQAVEVGELLKLLPHRYPFLLIDRIRDIDGNESAVGIKNVTVNEPHFQGHFPEQPVMPGVLIIEAMAQTAGAITIKEKAGDRPVTTVYFMTIDKVRFRKPVVPGDVLELHVELLRERGSMQWYRGEAKVDGAKVAEAEVSAMMVIGDEA